MSKITMQDIADALEISRVTVWKVFNNQNGVSETLRAKVLQKAEELGYRKSIPVTDNADIKTASPKKVALIVSRPESSTFWINIIHCIAKELAKNNLDLIYFYVPAVCPNGYSLPVSLSNGTVQGCIMLNIYDVSIIKLISQLSIPKVFLDTVPELTIDRLNGDLFLLEGTEIMRRLTNAMIERGHTKLGFIGDVAYARTNTDRYHGYKLAMEQHNLTAAQYCLTKSLDIYTYQDQIHAFLHELSSLPDGFICASDYVAQILQMYFTEHAVRVPEDIILTGYDNCSEFSDLSGLSATVSVDTSILGKRLADQILFRIQHPSGTRELIYMYSDIILKDEPLFYGK